MGKIAGPSNNIKRQKPWLLMDRLQILAPLRLCRACFPRDGLVRAGWGVRETSPCSWPLEEGRLRTKAASPPDLIARGPALPSLRLRGFMGPLSPPSLFQIIRKVVRQIDSSGAADAQEHEEVIAEGPLEDRSEMEADVDSFMRHAQVLRRLQPPGGSRGSRASGHPAPLRAAHLCARPLWASGGTTLPPTRLAPVPPCPLAGSVSMASMLSHAYLLSLCDPSYLLSLLLSPGGAARE